MINAIFVSLANATTGFPAANLNVHQSFVQDRDSDIAEIRNVLTSGNWAIAAFLTLAMRYDPYVSLMCPPGQVSDDFAAFLPQVGAVEGAKLIGNEKGPAFVGGSTVPMGDTPWPALKCKYDTASSIVVSTPGGTHYVPAYPVGDGTTLRVEWPAGLGVSGGIALEEPYGPSTAFSITVPGKYPYEDVSARLEALRGFFDLLSREDLVDAYYFSDSPQQKVCIAVLAVYKHFLSIQTEQ